MFHLKFQKLRAGSVSLEPENIFNFWEVSRYLLVCLWSFFLALHCNRIKCLMNKSFFSCSRCFFSPPVRHFIHHIKSRICYCPLRICMDFAVDQESIVLRGIGIHRTKKGLLCRDFLLLLWVVFVSAITECLPVVHWAMQLPSGTYLFPHCLPRGRSVCSRV